MNHTKPKHTAGPWIYQQSTNTVRVRRENYCICTLEAFTQGGSTDGALLDQRDDIGRLIACAPELLEFARLVSVQELGFLSDEALALIKRAEGRD